MFEDSLSLQGYAIVDFKKLEYLYLIQDRVKSIFPCIPTEFHQGPFNDDQRLFFIKQARDEIIKNELIKNFLLANSEFLVKLLGPDIDVQSEAYLRVSRPNLEKDFIDWHRDTFYGSSYWELNFWFPIFSLEKGAGLMIIEGSHLEVASNVRLIEDKNIFRSQVTKGSLANEVGYLYASKTDDTISNIDFNRVRLLAPELGQGIIFFTNAVHRAQNTSSSTRVSIDCRIKNMFASTYTKPGYYQPLLRSSVTNCVEKMMMNNKQS